jgi:hypothetical protein
MHTSHWADPNLYSGSNPYQVFDFTQVTNDSELGFLTFEDTGITVVNSRVVLDDIHIMG